MLARAVRRLSPPSLCRRSLPAMMHSSMNSLSNGDANGSEVRKPISHTVTALKRWSCDDRELPGKAIRRFHNYLLTNITLAVPDVKSIHVYDFDNTRMDPIWLLRLRL